MTTHHPTPETATPPRVAVILAAGRGTRMGSPLPKVLHEAAGRPLLGWVLEAARRARCGHIVVVVGHGADQVRERFEAEDITWVLQAEQRGTGHALAQTRGSLPVPSGERAAEARATLLVLSGDAPLVTPDTLDALARAAEGDAWGAMAVARVSEPGSLGRVLRDPDAPELLDRIVEASDASPEELAVDTVNAGFYALPAPSVYPYLDALSPDNAKGELYLTDALGAATAAGDRVRLVTLEEPSEAFGVNTPEELERAHEILDRRRGD